MWQGLRRHLFHNFGTKLIALILAVTLYLHVFLNQEREVILGVPLVLHGVPENLIGSGEIPAQARVRFRGLGLALAKMRTHPQGPRLVVEVGDVREGTLQRPLFSGDVHVPADVEVLVVEVEEPRELDIQFDRLSTRRLPVVPSVTGRPAPGYVTVGRVAVEPESVSVQGPHQRVSSLEFVKTEAVDITGLTERTAPRVDLRVPARCAADPARVVVRLEIGKVISRTFSGLAVRVHRSTDVTLKGLAPQTGSVVVSGPAALVDSLRAADLRLSIDALGLPPGTYTLMASVELNRTIEAGAVSVEPVEPERFEVELQ